MRIEETRTLFPGLQQEVYPGVPLTYLDNGATTQRPRPVIEAMAEASYMRNANIHRGVHRLSQIATEAHEAARQYTADFLNAREAAEILFVRGTTEAINLLAATYSLQFMQPGDEVILSEMEHHSNIVPWQLMAQQHGIELTVVPLSEEEGLEEGVLNMEAFRNAFTEKTKLVALTFASNVLGTINPVEEIIAVAHSHGVPVLLDAAQAIAHRPIDVQALDVDFLAFSAHKAYGPTGMGVLYGKREWLDRLPPYHGGGEMISHVSFSGTTFNELPFKFEAGTPDFLGSIGLQAGLQLISDVGFDEIQRHEKELLHYATQQLQQVEGLTIYGRAEEKEAVLSFLVEGVHHYDLGVLLDRQGVAIRTGHHCAQPLMERLGIEGTDRVSFAMYNTREDIDRLMEAMQKALKILR